MSYKTGTLIAAILGLCVVFLGSSIVTVALPQIGRELPAYLIGVLKGESYIYNGQLLGAAAFRPDKTGFFWLDHDAFVKFFAPDVDPIQARVMAAAQQPIAASEVLGEDPIGEPAWR